MEDKKIEAMINEESNKIAYMWFGEAVKQKQVDDIAWAVKRLYCDASKDMRHERETHARNEKNYKSNLDAAKKKYEEELRYRDSKIKGLLSEKTDLIEELQEAERQLEKVRPKKIYTVNGRNLDEMSLSELKRSIESIIDDQQGLYGFELLEQV